MKWQNGISPKIYLRTLGAMLTFIMLKHNPNEAFTVFSLVHVHNTAFLWGRTTLITVMIESTQRYKTHIFSSRYSPCVLFNFTCCNLLWNIKWRGRRLYVAYASVIKLSFARFAPTQHRDHHNLIMCITVVCFISKLYAIQALIFNCCHFRLMLFDIGIFTLVFLHGVYLLLCTCQKWRN